MNNKTTVSQYTEYQLNDGKTQPMNLEALP
jgi:hypothetical protein